MSEKILITSALPYANGPIHIGHLVEYIQTDIFARFLKLKGHDAIYCCADDQHGTPIEVNAMKKGITPEEFVAGWLKEHKKDFADFHIRFDNYYETNSPENKKNADFFFTTLKDKGFIYEKEIDQLYCEHDKRFLPDRFVKGTCPKCGAEDQYGDVCESCGSSYNATSLINPKCVICQNPPVIKKSTHFFFKLSLFSDKLRKWLTENTEMQSDIRNYVLSWIDKGLEDWCVSRDAPYFGFRIPGQTDKYYYVWLDAPIGYISSSENYSKKRGLKYEDYWKGKDGKIIHFIGKDIAYFHFLFWPAMLMGVGYNLPYNLVVHGFLTVNGEKMSKSRGTFIKAREYLDAGLNPEFLRYHYASSLNKTTSDIDLSFDDFKNRVNTELVSNIANLAYRCLSFTNKYYDGRLGELPLYKKENLIIEEIRDYKRKIDKNFMDCDFRSAVKNILAVGDIGNKYFQENAPWELSKTDKDKCQRVLTFTANIVKNISIMLAPILPEFSEKIQKQLGIEGFLGWEDINFGLEKTKIASAEIVLRKIEEINLGVSGKKEEPIPEIDFEIDDKVSDLGINAVYAIISGAEVRNKANALEKIKADAVKNFLDCDLSSDHIVKAYEELYKKIGAVVEQPMKVFQEMIKRSGRMPTINTIVDSYNTASIKSKVSMGAHDIGKIQGKIKLKIADGSELFIPLGKSEKQEIKKGEYVLADDKHVLCYLEVKQGEHTKIDKKTKNIFIYAQGNKETSIDYLEKSLKEACDLITKFSGGTYKLFKASKESDAFSKLDLRVAKIEKVEQHPNADNLYIEHIDVGVLGKRQIVSGLKGHYEPKELEGKKIIIIANLKPAKLRGVESEGMLLAAGSPDGKVGVLVSKDEPGAMVTVDGIKSKPAKKIDINEFKKLSMVASGKNVLYNGKIMKTDKGEIFADKGVEGKIW